MEACNKSEIRKEAIIVALISIAVFLINIYNIKDLSIPYVLDDEFGYWSVAAYFSGRDFSSAVSSAFYYSYGYPLVIAPLFFITTNPVILYKYAVVLNGLFMAGSFLLAYAFIKKIALNENKYAAFLATLASVVYPNSLVQSSIAWSESLLIFAFWAVVYLFSVVEEKASCFNCGLLGVLLMYLYMIHQRTIGIVLSGIAVFVLLKAFKRITWKQLTVFFLALAFMFIIHGYVKADIKANVWLNSSTLSNNDFSGQIKKIFNMFTRDGFITAVRVFSGHVFYILTASFLTVYTGIVYLIKTVFYDRLLEFKKHKEMNYPAATGGVAVNVHAASRKVLDRFWHRKDIQTPKAVFRTAKIKVQFIYLFLIMSFICSLIINVIFMNDPNRIDQVYYGRYIDTLVGPFIVIGLMKFGKLNKKALIILAGAILIVITGFISAPLTLRTDKFNFVCAVGLWRFYADGTFQVVKAVAYGILGSAFLFLPHMLNKPRLKNICLCILCTVFIITGKQLVGAKIIGSSILRLKNKEITDYVAQVPDLPVYYVLGEDFSINSHRDIIQYLLPEESLICVTLEELSGNARDKIVIINSANKYLFDLFEDYSVLKFNKYSCMFISNSLSKDFETLNSGEGLVIPPKLLGSQNNMDGESFLSSGQAGFLVFGPYITLNEGSYSVYLDLELINAESQDIGYADIVSSGNTISKIQLEEDNIYNTKSLLICLKLPIILK